MLNLRAGFEKLKQHYDNIIASAPTTWNWYCGVETADYCDWPRLAQVPHYLYKVIPMLIDPGSKDDSFLYPIRLGYASHVGSTMLKYGYSPEGYLDPVSENTEVEIDGRIYTKQAGVVWRLKRGDKLVAVEDGRVLYVVSSDISAARTHLVATMVESHVLETSYAG